MKNRIHFIFFVLIVMTGQDLKAGERLKFSSVVFLSNTIDSVESRDGNVSAVNGNEQSSRRTTALLYSCIMPGSGQTMLGNTYKGVGFTLVAFGSALTAGISHNNFIARNERLDALEFQYANATTWESADLLYSGMQSAHAQLKKDKNRRDLFLMISAVVWVVNIVDVLYFTEDQGQTLFSNADERTPFPVGAVDSPHNPLVSLSLPLQ